MYTLPLIGAAFLARSVLGGLVMNSDMKSAVPYYDPYNGGGSMLDNAGDGYGEPLNVIISGLSSSTVLNENGVINFARAIGFSEECFDIHLGAPQSANLGDGNGWVNQTIELRQDYDDASDGTCLETLIGGNHFRVFIQNGSDADSGALFLAVSKEEPLTEEHDIVPDGYNIGRNLLVQAAIGTTSFGGVQYTTTAQNISGLLPAGSEGVNHGIAVDGIVTILTVTAKRERHY
ncbi:hypothetical protein AcV5_007097 [Taiwanofungus camphoratus]|nr:hypothetical protein AcV5_007097 [Antrodia cinnamomea]KAI0958719.1 hypothetical protein AcV7_004453 [Antrodia cinnamomea]